SVCVFCLFGLADDLVKYHVVFALAYMASLKHSVCVRTALLSIDRIDRKCLCFVFDLCTGNALDTFTSHRFDLLNIKLSFSSHTDDIRFVSVHTVLFHQLLEAVCITWF